MGYASYHLRGTKKLKPHTGSVPTCEWHRDGPTNCLPARQNSDWNSLVQSNDESEAEFRLNCSVEMPPVDATGNRALSTLPPDDHILGPAEYWFGHGNCAAAAARRTDYARVFDTIAGQLEVGRR